mgnify:CR=1 FL=1
MKVKSLELHNFRNYINEKFEFHKDTNVLFGNNAQGKTNALEALFVCGTTKSHKGSKDSELIRWKEDEAHIRMIVDKKEIEYKIDMHLKKRQAKGIAINGFTTRKSKDLIGLVNIIFFSPEDLGIINNGPSERRRFLDIELCQLDKLYVSYLTMYQKALQQRNSLLKQIYYDHSLEKMLSVWDEKLLEYGQQIIATRDTFIKQLNEIVKKIHYNISDEKEILEISYDPNVINEDFKVKLKKYREKDLMLKNTNVGPHRDDILFYINGEDVRKYGSQGQKRTVALSLKLGEIDIVKEKIKEAPILLLDDVLSELDRNRQRKLLDNIKGIQTIITCTGLEEFINEKINIDMLFEIDNGVVKK